MCVWLVVVVDATIERERGESSNNYLYTAHTRTRRLYECICNITHSIQAPISLFLERGRDNVTLSSAAFCIRKEIGANVYCVL